MDACYFIQDGGEGISYVSTGLFYFIKSTFVLNCIHNEEILKVNTFFFLALIVIFIQLFMESWGFESSVTDVFRMVYAHPFQFFHAFYILHCMCFNGK